MKRKTGNRGIGKVVSYGQTTKVVPMKAPKATLPEYRCQGLSGMLLKELLQNINGNVYSTTRVSNIAPQKILTKNGFVRAGREFAGIEEPLCIWLYLKFGGVPWL